jgi:hypothetical protein
LLQKAGFAGAELAHASSLLTSHAIGSAATEAAWHRAVATSGMSPHELAESIEKHQSRIAANSPNLDAWWSETNTVDVAQLQEDGFNFGLERLLDGLEGWLARTKNTPPGDASPPIPA